ncbi:MAG: DUF1015 family protein [Lachnospiraceae bacterium]|nr:DUF1015 family protein [Lachnospiraceae bacterium]
MAVIKPFRAFRPKKGLEDRIAALPYDVYNREEALEVVQKEPLSFLKIDRAETQFSPEVNMYADCVYEKAASMLHEMMDKGEFVQDENACYYLYELTMYGRSQTGIVAVASVDDYCNGVIKKHENTRADKELDRIRHVDTCEAQTGPIFLAYRNEKTLSDLVATCKEQSPVYDFVSEDEIRHRVWVISDISALSTIETAFAGMNRIYIADGHHRCASATRVSLKRREEHPDFTGDEEYNYFLSVLFPDSELMIMDYNRVIKDLHGMTPADFLEKVKKIFSVTAVGQAPYHPSKKGEFGMLLEDTWYKLNVDQNSQTGDPVADLDVSILQNKLLEPVLGITDPKTDSRIDFVGGIRGLDELERRCKQDAKVAFSMYPTSIQELFAVADAGMLMPPKSTWFEPKLRSGIFIHDIR